MEDDNKPGLLPQSTKPDAGAAPAAGAVDIEPIVAKAEANIPPKLKGVYDQLILKGMRIMFSKQTHEKMFLEPLSKPGPLPDKMAQGMAALIYLLWTQSNKTFPPQLVVPVAFTLTLRAFDFLQKSGEAEATKEALGEAVEKSTVTVMGKFGVAPEQIEQLANKNGAAALGEGTPAGTTPPGLLQSGAKQ